MSDCPVVAWLVDGDVGPVFKRDAAFTDIEEAKEYLWQQDYNKTGLTPLVTEASARAALAERDALIERYRNALTVIINSPGGGPAKRIATQVLGEYLVRAVRRETI